MLENKFYKITERRIHPYDIEIFFNKNEITQQEADSAFMQELRRIVLLNKGSERAIRKFLSYQLENSKATEADFKTHTRNILLGKEFELNPYRLSAGFIFDWLKFQNIAKAENKNQFSEKNFERKPDRLFSEIFVEKGKMNLLLEKLKAKQIIDEDGKWIEPKTKLVALYKSLIDKKLIKGENFSEIGRIFCSQFKIKMNERLFTTSPKAKNMDWVEVEILSKSLV